MFAPTSLPRLAVAAFATIFYTEIATAQQTPNPASPRPSPQAPRPLPIFDVAQTGVVFQTGDTWTQGGQTFRLYGVQSCIRGTVFTNATGGKVDCGEASIAYLAALIRDTKPRCTAIAQTESNPPVIYSVCAAHIGQNTLDLGTVIITQGFGFAATDPSGKAVNVQYAVAEGDARAHRRGLWIDAHLPNASEILRAALKASAHSEPKQAQ